MSDWAELASTSGLTGALVLLIQAGAKWLRVRSLAARVRREATEPGGPEFGTIGWVWKELGVKIGEVRSKGHSNEAWLAQQAERIAAIEQELFGAARMTTGEQERIDVAKERRALEAPRRPAENDTDPVPAPPFRQTSDVRRRSRP